MTLFSKNRIASPLVVAFLLLALSALMYLQYEWSKHVNDATETHIASDLRKSILGWHLELFRTLAGAPVSLRVNAEPADFQDRQVYISRYVEWRARTLNSSIVSNVYIWRINGKRHATLLRLDTKTRSFEPAPSSEKFDALRKRLQENSAALALAIAGASSPEEFFSEHPQKNKPFQTADNYEDALGGWIFVPEIPALFHPIAHQAGLRAQKMNRLRADWLVIEYDADNLRMRVFPELAQRYFGGQREPEYLVRVVAGTDERSMIFTSERLVGSMQQPDATLNLFGPSRVPSLAPSSNSQLDLDAVAPFKASEETAHYYLRGAFWFPVIHTTSSGADWYLVVKRRRELNEMFAGLRHRELAISFGIVFVLVATMGLILLASRRAQDLAKLQVDFVTGVSHDLRTPLAVISLAADNLADGVVDGREAAVRYGAQLQAEVKQLGERVEQALSFASLNRNRKTYNIGPVKVKSVIGAALQHASALLEKEGVAAEVNVEDGLPLVAADHVAVSQALQNLITNAVKYGGEDHWLGISAGLVGRGSSAEIQIKVEDHGIGIEKNELKSIFEPFYRGSGTLAQQIHGTGLGLTLAKHTAEAVGGSLSVYSVPGKGSTFVLHLPVMRGLTQEALAETVASS